MSDSEGRAAKQREQQWARRQQQQPQQPLQQQRRQGQQLQAQPLPSRAAVFWDLDNKHPFMARPWDVAVRLRDVAAQFAQAVDILAYANSYAFEHVPGWVREERRQRREEEQLELAGEVTRDEPLVCGVCGRRCKTSVELRKHFVQLHQREHQKRMAHLNSVGPGRKKKLRSKWQEKAERYRNTAQEVLVPKRGYGLMPELRRAGVFVRLVSQAPQAADNALIADLQKAVRSRQVGTVCVVSDDRGYTHSLEAARECGLRTIAIGSVPTLKSAADLWLPWEDVASGRAVMAANVAVHRWQQVDILAGELDVLEEEEEEGVGGEVTFREWQEEGREEREGVGLVFGNRSGWEFERQRWSSSRSWDDEEDEDEEKIGKQVSYVCKVEDVTNYSSYEDGRPLSEKEGRFEGREQELWSLLQEQQQQQQQQQHEEQQQQEEVRDVLSADAAANEQIGVGVRSRKSQESRTAAAAEAAAEAAAAATEGAKRDRADEQVGQIDHIEEALLEWQEYERRHGGKNKRVG